MGISPVQPSLFSHPIFLVAFFLIIFVAILVAVVFIWRSLLRKNHKLPPEFKKVVLRVSVPKESGSVQTAAQNESGGVQKIQEQISWAENLWASLGGMKPPSGLKAWLYGRHDEISLEIVARNNLIYFYVVVPLYLHSYIEQQIQAQYPHAQIEVEEDYNIFMPNGHTAGTYLELIKPDIFPIKTFRKMDVDPLNAITNSLSKLNKDEGAVIQVIIRPTKKDWHGRGRKVVESVMSGKKMKEALKGAGGQAWYEKVAHSALTGVSNAALGSGNSPEEKSLSPSPQLSAFEQESLKSIEEKSSKAGLEANIRIVCSSPSQTNAKSHLSNILNSFAQYNIYEYGNGFKPAKLKRIESLISNFIHRDFGYSYVLNTEELASIFHLPLGTSPTPNIKWLGARKAAPPSNMPQEGLILGKNIYRGKETIVRIKRDDRRRHVYIIGMTGTGKSKLMVNMALQDIQNGEGVCYIDPHGEETELIAANIPKERMNDVIYFNPADIERPIGLNMLEADNVTEKDFAVQEMIKLFYKLVTDPSMLGPMFEHYMRNAMLLLMADPEDQGTLVEIPRVFVDEEFRQVKLAKCTDILVKDYWTKEYPASQRGTTASDMLSYVVAKVGRFIENEMIRNIIGQERSGFNVREIMDNKKILLVNLSKGLVGEVNSDLLGMILVAKIQMAAMARADIPQEQRHDFYLYIDEFQNYVTDSIATILAEARKYRLNLTMAHQYIGQLTKNSDTAVRDAVFGNVGTLCTFRVGVEDAEFLVKNYTPVFNEFDLINIEKINSYCRLMINMEAARPFNMQSMPMAGPNLEVLHTIIEQSRLKYGQPKAEVEAEIARRSKLGEMGMGESKTEVDMR